MELQKTDTKNLVTFPKYLFFVAFLFCKNGSKLFISTGHLDILFVCKLLAHLLLALQSRNLLSTIFAIIVAKNDGVKHLVTY